MAWNVEVSPKAQRPLDELDNPSRGGFPSFSTNESERSTTPAGSASACRGLSVSFGDRVSATTASFAHSNTNAWSCSFFVSATAAKSTSAEIEQPTNRTCLVSTSAIRPLPSCVLRTFPRPASPDPSNRKTRVPTSAHTTPPSPTASAAEAKQTAAP